MDGFGMEQLPAGGPDNRFLGKKTGADMITVLDMTGIIVDGNPVADGIKDCLELARFGAKTQIGRFQLVNFQFYVGIKTDLGTVKAQKTIETCFINMGTFDFVH